MSRHLTGLLTQVNKAAHVKEQDLLVIAAYLSYSKQSCEIGPIILSQNRMFYVSCDSHEMVKTSM